MPRSLFPDESLLDLTLHSNKGVTICLAGESHGRSQNALQSLLSPLVVPAVSNAA
jgi:hypothetical protein